MENDLDDVFFVSPRAKAIFCLLRNNHGDLDKDLGITHVCYLDGAIAAKWKAQMLTLLEITEEGELPADIMPEVRRRVLQTYKRMVGLA
jgi:hypothetical protein